MKKLVLIIALLLINQSCDDKKAQQFGGINLTIQKQTYEESSEVENEVDVEVKLDEDDFELTPLKNKEIKTNAIKSDDVFRSFRIRNENDLGNNQNIENSENQITDIDAVRVTLNNGQPTTVPIINGSASYSRDGLAVGVIPIKVDLLGGGLEKYTQTKSVSIVANQNASVSFNSFFIMNQQISITNSSFGNTVVQGDQISFDWTNTHAEQPVQIAVIQNNDTNIIQTLESSYIGTSYVLNTTNSNPTNNIGFKVISNVASNTSSSICCFDLVANAPEANDVSSTVNEDSSVTIQLDGSSPGGESVTYSIVSNPSNGSLSGISGSNVTYTPNQDYNGSDSFTYRANNGSQDSNTATVTLTINAVNDAPVANNISAETNYNEAVDLQFDASDIDGDNLSYFIVSGASNGTLTLHSNNQVEYLPNSGFSGNDSFTYGATDGSLNSNTATATVAVGEAIEVTFPNGGEELSVNETYNLTWNNGFSNTGIELRKDGSKILDISGDAGNVNSFSWTVPSDLTPGDGYVIRVYDAGAGSEFDESDNTFSILDPSGTPTYSETNNSSLLFGEDSVIKLTEFDEDLGKIGSSMTISLWFKTTHNPNQDVLIHGNGSSAQFGHLGFTTAGAGGKAYLVSAGGTNLQLSDSNDFTNDRNWNHMAYVIDGDNSNIRFYVNGVLENSGSFSSGASFNAFDRQWEIGHWTKDSNQNFDFQGYIDDVGVWNTNLSDQEIADIYNDGNPTLAHKIKESNLRAYYDFENSSMSNKTGREKNGTPIGNPISNVNVGFSSDVPDVNDAPTTEDINVTIDENRNSLRMANISLAGNDPDGDNLTYSLVTTPQNGSFSIDGNILTYEPNKDWYGSEVFTYKANDGNLDSNTSTITITVNSVNDTPIINSGSSLYLDGVDDYAYISAENNNINLSTSDFTLAAWIILEGLDDTNAANIMSTGTGSTNNGLYFMIDGGELELSFYGNNFLETSDLGFEGDNTWHHVTATFEASSRTAKLYVDGVLEATDSFDSTFAGEGTNFTVGTTAWNLNDNFEGYIDEAAVWNEVLNTSQIISLADDSRNPLEIGTASAYWEFEPDTNNPTIITDLTLNGNNLQNNGTIETNGTKITTSTLEDTSVNIQLYVNDVDGDALSYSIVDNPTNGSTSINSNIITYTPSENYFGSDTFTYKASDGNLESDTGSVDVTVVAVNDAPVSSAVSLSLLKNATKTISLSATDVDGDNLTYSIVSNVSNGTLGSISGNQISYTPNNNFLGTDTFTFKANDGTVDSNIETVTITVKAVSITSPNGGETLTHNTTATITWDGGFTNTGIELYKNGSKILDISGDAGDVNSYQWNVPSGVGTGSDFTVKVYDAGPGNESDESDATFTIQENGSVINVPGDYNSIQDAINNASDGTKIIVASGTYNVNDLNITKDIILKGSGMGSTILDGQGSNRIMTINATGQDTLRIIDMTIKNGNALSGGGYVVGFEGSSTIAKFENIVFENNGAGTGNTLFRGLGPDKTFYVNSVIRNNSAENNSGIGSATIHGCLIYGNTGSNNSSPVLESKVYSTTITGNSGGVSNNAWTNGGATNSQITNSIIYGNSPKDLYYYSNSPYSGVTYSTITNGYSGTGNISSDPQFNNSGAQNYGLSSSSPALNNGDPSMTNPDGTRIDMGAYLDSNGNVYDDPNSEH